MSRPDDLDQKLLSAIDRLGAALRVSRQGLATDHNLTSLQVLIVEALSETGSRGVRIGSLAAEVGVSSPTVSDAVSSLVQKRLAHRAPDPIDGRATLLSLTRQGRNVASSIDRGFAPIHAAAAAWDAAGRGAALTLMLESIASLHRAGVITIDRSCMTCHHFEPGRGGHAARCRLLGLDLRPADLRVRCPEHADAAIIEHDVVPSDTEPLPAGAGDADRPLP